MKLIKVSSGPHKDLYFQGHEDAAAYDAQAGKIGACVEAADLSDIYRSLLPEAHDEFAKVLVKAGVPRGVDAKATERAKATAKDPTKVEDVPEKYVQWANRVRATLLAKDPNDPEAEAPRAAEWAALDAEIHDIAKAMLCDSSPTTRSKGINKEFVAKAESILAETEDVRETKITKILSRVDVTIERDEAGTPDRDSLARAIEAYFNAEI